MNDWEEQPLNRPVFRHGQVHVNAEQCATCVYRPGNLMHLKPGALQAIIMENLERNTVLICHENMDTNEPGTCRGFYESHLSPILALAAGFGCLAFQPVVAQDNSKTTPGE